jgi:hypothetical protein
VLGRFSHPAFAKVERTMLEWLKTQGIVTVEWLNTNAGAVTAIATVVLTATTIVYAWLTGILAVENRRLRRAGTEPEIIAYLFPDARHITILHLIIANVGRGPARNVSLEFEADADDFASHGIEHRVGARRTLVSFLPQDERLFHFFGNALDMFKPGPPKDFKVHIRYEDMKGRSHSREYKASVSDLEGFRRIGEPPEYTAAEALKGIKDEITQWGSGFKRLKVETVTTAEEQKQSRERHEQYLARKQARKQNDSPEGS